MKLVTGGAGFIGSHLVDALLSRGHEVRVLDNLNTGRKEFLEAAHARGGLELQRGDVFKPADLRRALRGADEVYHMAADPDVRAGVERPWENFRDGAVATFRVLDAVRRSEAQRFVFASSSVVYGEAARLPTPEDYGPLLPISPYGASKLAAEAAVSAFVGTYGLRAWIFRFGNVVGPRVTHGVVYDFAQQLRKDPSRLRILGDGNQEKAYLSIQDCIDGMLHGVEHAKDPANVLNLASGTTTHVRRIAVIVTESFGLSKIPYEFTGGDRGWPGDVRRMSLDISRIRALGWKPRHTSEDAVRLAAQWLAGPPAGTVPRRTRAARVK